MSLSEQIQRVDGSQNSILSKIAESYGIDTAGLKIDELSAAIMSSGKFRKGSLLSDETAALYGFVENPGVTVDLSTVKEGDVVELPENGKMAQFYVGSIDYEPSLNGSNRVLLVRKSTYTNGRWNSSNVNTYANSVIDNWFNTTYKNMLSDAVLAEIGTTKFYYTVGGGDVSVTTLERSVFALSATELGSNYAYINKEGESLPVYHLFITGNQWSRSPMSNPPVATAGVASFTNSSINGNNPTNSSGYRPCFTLPSTFKHTWYILGDTVFDDPPEPPNPVPDDIFLILYLGKENKGYKLTFLYPDGTPASGLKVNGIKSLAGDSVTTDDNGFVFGVSTASSVNISVESPYVDFSDISTTVYSLATVTTKTITFEKNQTAYTLISSSKTLGVYEDCTLDLTAVGAGGGGACCGSNANGGGGGGGNVQHLSQYSFKKGDQIKVAIGAKGNGGYQLYSSGNKGGTTDVSVVRNSETTSILSAEGGNGGSNSAGGTSTNGGNGGSANSGGLPCNERIFNDDTLPVAGSGGGGGGFSSASASSANRQPGGSPNGGHGASVNTNSKQIWNALTGKSLGGGGGGGVAWGSPIVPGADGAKGGVYYRIKQN